MGSLFLLLNIGLGQIELLCQWDSHKQDIGKEWKNSCTLPLDAPGTQRMMCELGELVCRRIGSHMEENRGVLAQSLQTPRPMRGVRPSSLQMTSNMERSKRSAKLVQGRTPVHQQNLMTP